jgi:hypothetical protein
MSEQSKPTPNDSSEIPNVAIKTITGLCEENARLKAQRDRSAITILDAMAQINKRTAQLDATLKVTNNLYAAVRIVYENLLQGDPSNREESRCILRDAMRAACGTLEKKVS